MSKRLLSKQANEDDILYLYWVMMQTLEYKLDMRKDILDKDEVEAAYRAWNRVHGTNLRPYWLNVAPNKEKEATDETH